MVTTRSTAEALMLALACACASGKDAGVDLADALGHQLASGEAGGVALANALAGAVAGGVGVVDVAQLAGPRYRGFAVGCGVAGALEGFVQLGGGAGAVAEEVEGLVEGRLGHADRLPRRPDR